METPCPPGDERPECADHPAAPAVAKCVGCNKLLCAFCRYIYGNRSYCRSCLEKSGISTGAPAGVQHEHGYDQQHPPPPPPTTPEQWRRQGQGFGQPPPPGMPAWRSGLAPGPPPGYYPPYPPAVYRPAHEVVFENAPWGVGEAIIIFLIAFVAASIVAFFLALVLKGLYSTTTASIILIFLSSVVLYAFLLAGTFYSVKVRHGSNLSALGLRLHGLGKGVLMGFGVGVPLFFAAIFVAYIVQKIFGPTNTDQVSNSVNRIASGSVSAGLIALLAITLVVLAPICEEIFFRGYLYPALRNRMSKQPAMVLNGLLFAAAHFELIGFLPRFLLGWGLCYIYEKNRTLGGPITGHALYNGLILLLSGILHIF